MVHQATITVRVSDIAALVESSKTFVPKWVMLNGTYILGADVIRIVEENEFNMIQVRVNHNDEWRTLGVYDGVRFMWLPADEMVDVAVECFYG